jgi:hypothetical protein
LDIHGVSKELFTLNKHNNNYIVARMWRLLKDGYWIDNCVYWITVYTLQFTTVHTLYNSQLSPSLPLKT